MRNSPPQTLLPWLMHTESLTKKLEDYVGKARLEVIQQHWETNNWWDHYVLKLARNQSSLHRDILIWANKTACWFARTILPRQTYLANSPLFDRLKTESLTRLIFETDALERVSLTHYCITQESIEYYWIPEALREKEKELWLRFSVYKLTDFSETSSNEPLEQFKTSEQLHLDYLFYLCEVLFPVVMRYT